MLLSPRWVPIRISDVDGVIASCYPFGWDTVLQHDAKAQMSGFVLLELASWCWCLVFILGVSLLPYQANTG